jgi:hypothetical protein
MFYSSSFVIFYWLIFFSSFSLTLCQFQPSSLPTTFSAAGFGGDDADDDDGAGPHVGTTIGLVVGSAMACGLLGIVIYMAFQKNFFPSWPELIKNPESEHAIQIRESKAGLITK